MAKLPLDINIAGRVKKVKARDPLLPLFEAVMNSIHAIEDSEDRTGSIEIELCRGERAQGDLPLTDEPPPVTALGILDTGVGFTEENLKSFLTSDSRHRATKGGKGVGRFTFLKFFDVVHVDSVAQEGSERVRRRFLFTLDGVSGEDPEALNTDVPLETRIELRDLKGEYELPRQLEAIAERIVEHFLVFFATDSAPHISVRDGNEVITLKSHFRQAFGAHAKHRHFEVSRHRFSASSLRLYRGNRVHTVFFCANKRVATRLTLQQFEPILQRKLRDSEDQSFAYWVFLESVYLDGIVNDDRDGFRFPDEHTTVDFERDVTRSAIIEALLPVVSEELAEELQAVRNRNVERVREYVETQAPEYRYVVEKKPDLVERIAKEDQRDIDVELRKIQFEMETATRSQTNAVLDMLSSESAPVDEVREKTQEVVDGINEIGKASLAKYVAHRRVLLTMLEKRMQLDASGKYSYEEAIHELVFPLRQTSDALPYDRQNLWIIDERLAFHSYLASDTPLRSTPAPTESGKEPDIIIFNQPILVSDQTSERVFESLEILEFKRPGIDDYTDQKNPAVQVMEYIELIQDGKRKDRSGRPIEVKPSTHYYCYILCDLTTKLRKILRRSEFIETPDNRGMFKLAKNHNAYIEVLSYSKMLDLAEQRNRVLFEKAGINRT